MTQTMSFSMRRSILLFITMCCLNVVLLPAKNYEHFILYGQSLSTGHQSWPPLSTESVQGNFMLGNQVWINFGNNSPSKLNPLIANVASTTAALPKKRASMIYGEAPIVAAVNHIQLKTNGQFKLIASSCGTGARTIEELSKEYYSPSYYTHFSNAISNAAFATRDSIHCPAIIWMQGEYNYTVPSGNNGLTKGSRPTANKAIYKSLLLKLKDNMQSDLMKKYKQSDIPLFITYQVGAQYSRGTTLAIGMARLEAANENADIICAGPVYPMTDRGGHLDSNGYRWYGEMLGKTYYRTKILGEDFKPLQPLEIARTADPKVLKIKFLVPELPLILDESIVKKVTSYGFEIYLNKAKKIISDVIIDGDCVYISCTSDLTGDIEVVYAGTSNAGHGNLRDSDAYPAYYNYLDLDQKNGDGSYVYERDATETTLRPASSEPRDAQGIIYDKPYPLFNFSVAFYYQLKASDQVYLIPNLDPNTAIFQPITIDNTFVSYTDGTLSVTTSLSNYKGIELMDLSGKSIITHNGAKKLNNFTYLYSAPQLSNGVYLVKVLTSNNHQTLKLILQ